MKYSIQQHPHGFTYIMALLHLNGGHLEFKSKLIELSQSAGISLKFRDFLISVNAKVNTENSAKESKSALSPKLYQVFPFLCTVPLNQDGLLSITDAQYYCANDGHITKDPYGDAKHFEMNGWNVCEIPKNIDIYRDFLDGDYDARASFNKYSRKKRKEGYEIIHLSYNLTIDAGRHDFACRWCGKEFTPDHPEKSKYCENENACKKKAESFMITYRTILKAWNEYREYHVIGDIEKIKEMKSKSKYAYLLDDDERYKWVTYLVNEGKTPLKEIKAMLRPLRNIESPDGDKPLTMFDYWSFSFGEQRAICPVCGRFIRDDQNITAQFCSNKCYRTHLYLKKNEP